MFIFCNLFAWWTWIIIIPFSMPSIFNNYYNLNWTLKLLFSNLLLKWIVKSVDAFLINSDNFNLPYICSWNFVNIAQNYIKIYSNYVKYKCEITKNFGINYVKHKVRKLWIQIYVIWPKQLKLPNFFFQFLTNHFWETLTFL